MISVVITIEYSSIQYKITVLYIYIYTHHTQNCLLRTGKTGNLNLLFFIIITAFRDSYLKIEAVVLRRSALEI